MKLFLMMSVMTVSQWAFAANYSCFGSHEPILIETSGEDVKLGDLSGKLLSTEGDLFQVSAYELMDLDGQEGKLTLSFAPSFGRGGRGCGRGGCMESIKKTISAQLTYLNEEKYYACYEVIRP